jgi:outer membrane protein
MARQALAIAVLIGLVSSAHAQDYDHWIARVGIHSVQPKSANHSLVDVSEGSDITFSGTYMMGESIGIELLAALPVIHDINFNGGAQIAAVKQLPPTLSLQYHLDAHRLFRPYFGAGLNYTFFFDEKTVGALRGSHLELDPSIGIALQAGVDTSFDEHWFANVDVRWLDIDTKAHLNGISIGTIEIDPYAIGLSIGRRF